MKEKIRGDKKRGKLLRSVLLLLCATAIWGCGTPKDGAQKSSSKTESAAGENSREGTGGNAKGRYVETPVQMPEDFNNAMAMQKLEDGRILILDQTMQRFVSGDDGMSWEKQDDSWQEEAGPDSYIQDCALAPDGSFASLYMKSWPEDDEEEEEKKETEGQDSGKEGAGEKENGEKESEAVKAVTEETEGQETGGENTEEQDPEGEDTEQPEYYYAGGYVDANGNWRELPLDDAALDGDIYKLCGIAPDGRVLVVSSSNTIYAVDPADGKAESLFQAEGRIAAGRLLDRKLALPTSEQFYLYDFDAGSLLETDEVLQTLIVEKLGAQIGMTEFEPLAMAQGDVADELYIAYREGVYRHTVGGAGLEQVILGGLTSFGDPQANPSGIVRTSDGGFLAAFSDGKVCRYTFDENMSAVPEKQLTVYSLHDNYTVRQAISLYQKQHPDVYIRFENGLTNGDSGKTQEDAVKQLNTELLAGKGPDMLMLDGLPAESYQEKGVLMDLSEVIASLSGENTMLFNLLDAYREQDGKIYSLPARFRLPLLAGKKDRIVQITDLKTLAYAAEAIRAGQPEGMIFNTILPEPTLRLLGLTSSGAWLKENGSIDEAALTEFFTQARRIYQAEAAGISEEERQAYKTMEMVVTTDVAGEGNYYLQTNNNLWPLCESNPEVLAAGMVKDARWTFPLITSVILEHPEYDFTAYQGQIQNGFLPKAQTAICAGSEQKELAEDFFAYLFSLEAQSIETVDGYPVNEAALTDMLEAAMKGREGEEGEEDASTDTQDAPAGEEAASEDMLRTLGGIGSSDEDGNFIMLKIYAPTQEQTDRFLELVKAADTPCAGNAVIEELAYEIGGKILEDEMTVEEGVAQIMKRAALYLAE